MGFVNSIFDNVSNGWNSLTHPNYSAIDAELRRGEKILNTMGYFPGVSLVTGQLRESLGYLEIAMGLAFGCFHQAAARLTKDEEVRREFYDLTERDFSYCINGVGNIFRGHLEKAPIWAISSLIFTKVILASYDALHFRMNYGHEKLEENEVPLMRQFEEL